MSLEPLPLNASFEKARRRDAYRRLARLVKGREPEPAPLDEVRRRLRLFDQSYEGVRAIPVEKIVGSAVQSRDFDENFLPLRPEVRERWRQVELAFPHGAFPPIVVYQLTDAYFVVDGHHRVAIAKQRGVDFIDAEVTKLQSRFPIPSDADIGRIIMLEQQKLFLEESGLERARPEANIEFSRPHGYVELLELINSHGYHVVVDRGEVVAIEDVAAHWYDHVYLPAVQAVRNAQLGELFRDATEADLFLLIWQRRRALFPHRGGMGLDEAARVTREDASKPKGGKARVAAKKLARRNQPGRVAD